jgi:hypothetical protein
MVYTAWQIFQEMIWSVIVPSMSCFYPPPPICLILSQSYRCEVRPPLFTRLPVYQCTSLFHHLLAFKIQQGVHGLDCEFWSLKFFIIYIYLISPLLPPESHLKTISVSYSLYRKEPSQQTDTWSFLFVPLIHQHKPPSLNKLSPPLSLSNHHHPCKLSLWFE